MNQALAASRGPARPRSRPSRAQRSASMTTPRAIGRILDREAKLELQGSVAEPPPLQPDEGDLVVVLPRDVVGWADVDVSGFQPFVELALYRLGLRALLRLEAASLQHVEEVGVSARVELIGAVEPDPAVGEKAAERAMDDGGPHLALHVVAHQRQSGVPEPVRPSGVGGEEDGHAVDERDPRVEARLRVVAYRLLRADGEIADEHLRPGRCERFGYVYRRFVRRPERFPVAVVRHVIRDAVEHRPHPHPYPARRKRGLEDPRAVGGGEHRFLQRASDLAGVDVERGHDLEVGRLPSPDVLVHEPCRGGHVPRAVVLDPLHERAGAIADPGHRDPDPAHVSFSFAGVPAADHAKRSVVRSGPGKQWIRPAGPGRAVHAAGRPFRFGRQSGWSSIPVPTRTMELPRLGEPLNIVRRRCSDGRKTFRLRGGVSAPDGGPCPGRSHARRARSPRASSAPRTRSFRGAGDRRPDRADGPRNPPSCRHRDGRCPDAVPEDLGVPPARRPTWSGLPASALRAFGRAASSIAGRAWCRAVRSRGRP